MMQWQKSRKVKGIAMEEAVRTYENGSHAYYYRLVGNEYVIRHNQWPTDEWVVEDSQFNTVRVFRTKVEAVWYLR